MGIVMEEWRDVIGFEGLYKVSNFGRIQTVKTGKIKEQTISKTDNRPYLSLWKNNKIKVCRPHKLVMEAFVSLRPEGLECCHNDGNPQNNHWSNLRWDTPKNNHADKIKHGTTNRGEQCGTAKLTLEQVRAIRQDNRLQRIIAAEYGVKDNTISRIKSFKRWAHDV
jgi:NUMOD4 motif/HNH endonuclease